jgi:hypothetical protein
MLLSILCARFSIARPAKKFETIQVILMYA